jgi:signal transduction histidine kinase
MEPTRTIEELKVLAAGSSPMLGKIEELEQQIAFLIRRTEEQQKEFSARLSSIRHNAAQPLTTVQLFLDLLPSVMRQEQMVPEKLVNPHFWTQTHQKALDAVRSIPKILAG